VQGLITKYAAVVHAWLQSSQRFITPAPAALLCYTSFVCVGLQMCERGLRSRMDVQTYSNAHHEGALCF
jgi:hypothetical protein